MSLPAAGLAGGLTLRALRLLPGLLLAAGLAALALGLSRWPLLSASGLGVMTLAIVLGMALGHTGYRHLAPRCGPGIDLARSRLLRQLVDYRRVHLLPGESQVVAFAASSRSLRMADRATGDIVSTPGDFDLVVTNGVTEVARRRVVVEGDEVVVERFPAAAAAAESS